MQRLRENFSFRECFFFTYSLDFVQPEIKHKQHEIMLLYVAVVRGEYVTHIFRLGSIFFLITLKKFNNWIFGTSIKSGRRNILEHPGTSRKTPEH